MLEIAWHIKREQALCSYSNNAPYHLLQKCEWPAMISFVDKQQVAENIFSLGLIKRTYVLAQRVFPFCIDLQRHSMPWQ